MSARVLVLGCQSFSGSHFVKGCIADPEVSSCLGISRSGDISPVFLPYLGRPECGEKFQFHALDLNKNLGSIVEQVDAFKPDYFVNFAAQSMVAESWAHPEHWMMTNVVSTIKLHDELRRRPFIRKYVHVSTPEVYGSCSGLVQENAHYAPSTPYAVSRAAADLSLMSFYKNYGFPVVFTRAANVYGPGQQLYRIIPRTILSIRTGTKLPLHGGGHSVRSFIHIDDVVDGTLRVMREGTAPEIYHLSTERQISIRDVVQLICERMGRTFDSVVDIVGDRPGKDQAYLLDSTKAKSTLGWKDYIGLEQGIDETIRWVDENLATLKALPQTYVHKE